METKTPSIRVRNKRLKMSPGGVITLPVSARRALGMQKGQGAVVGVAADNTAIQISNQGDKGIAVRISPGGNLELPPGCRTVLARGTRHYGLDAFDAEGRVVLVPLG